MTLYCSGQAVSDLLTAILTALASAYEGAHNGRHSPWYPPGDTSMRTRLILLPLAVALFAVPAGRSADTDTGDTQIPKGFTALCNGKDLSGWKVHGGKMNAWGVTDKGILFVQGGGGGWLMTEKEYGDFELRLEFKMPKMGNSGVGIRAPRQGDPAYQGMEIQLLDDANWKGLRPAQHTGSIYDVVPPKKVVTRAHGEWNQMTITAKGRKITVKLNDTQLVDANLDDYKEHYKKHPGLQRTKGHIGLQSYNFRVEFRNLWIKPLDDKDK
jgi:hypothetical protein